jgi:hypothetical protein
LKYHANIAALSSEIKRKKGKGLNFLFPFRLSSLTREFIADFALFAGGASADVQAVPERAFCCLNCRQLSAVDWQRADFRADRLC